TAATIRDGWLHTGDVVREEDGQLRIVDRLKDIMITAGGKNLTPSEIENTMKASPFIKECIVVAERRRFVSALIQIDYETVGKWAESRRIPFTHFRSLVEAPEVRELIESEVARGNAKLAQVAQIRRFHLLTKELDHDAGEVTATMKVRRASICEAAAPQIEAIYEWERMLGAIWFGMFLIAGLAAFGRWIFAGDPAGFAATVDSMFAMAKLSVEVMVLLFGTLTLWLGFLRIAEGAGLVDAAARLLGPLFARLMPGVPRGHPALGLVTMNFAANAIGLDNAATPIGLRAMGELQKLN